MLSQGEVEHKFRELMDKYRISCGPTGCQQCADNKYDLLLALINEYADVYPGLNLRTRMPKKCTFPYGIPE